MQIQSNISKSRSNNSEKQQNVEKFTSNLMEKLIKYFQQNKKKTRQSNELQLKKKTEQKLPSNTRESEELFQQFNCLYQRIMKIKNRIQKAQKLKQQRIFFYNGKLAQFLASIKMIMDKTELNGFKINKYVAQLISVTSKTVLQTDRILTGFEKQSNSFCCGRTTELKHYLDQILTELIGYGFLWRQIQKLSPFMVQITKQIVIPLQYSQHQLKQFIKNQITGFWPQSQTVIRQIYKERPIEIFQCDRPHVDSKVSVSSVSLQKTVIQQQKLVNNATNYMKVQEILKLKDDLQTETIIRESHQKLFGFCRPQQIQQAISNYLKIVQNQCYNYVIALNALGIIFQQGKYVSPDRQRSMLYFKKSAELQNPQGLYKIGKYYEKGILNILFNQNQSSFMNKNTQMRSAIQFYQKAAEFDHLDAITDLGFIYQKGILSNTCISQSKVSQTDNSNSYLSADNNVQYFLQPNLQYAMKYYAQAKKQNFPRAINNLGTLYIKEADLFKQKVKGANAQKGIKYLKKASTLNYVKAFYNLGKCYENGIGVTKNLLKAKNYYQKGSEKGDISCKLQYVKCLISGKNILQCSQQDQNLQSSLQMLRNVLIQDPQNSQALYYLGIFNQIGIGMDPNKQMAYFYVNKAAKKDFVPAITRLGDYYYSGFYVKKNIQKAIKFYQKSVRNNDAQAKLNIALMIQKGLIKPSNGQPNQVVNKLYKQALLQDNSNAYLLIGLRNQNYHLPNQGEELNSKIKRSLQLGNKDTIKLLQKASHKKIMRETNATDSQNLRVLSNNLMKQGFQKCHGRNTIAKAKSVNNFEIYTSRS